MAVLLAIGFGHLATVGRRGSVRLGDGNRARLLLATGQVRLLPTTLERTASRQIADKGQPGSGAIILGAQRCLGS